MGLNPKAMRQVQQFQDQLQKIQEELGKRTVEGTAGGGVVRVVMNGHQEVQEITIAPEVTDPAGIAMLQDLIIAAVNQAVARSRGLGEQSMGTLLGKLGIPGLI
jgi:hypothetical protein